MNSAEDRHYSRRPPPDNVYERRDSGNRRDYSPPPRGYESSNRGRDYDRREPRERAGNYYDRSSPPRDTATYQRQSGYDSRERYGNGGNSSGSTLSVGYGSSAGGRGGKPDGAPPGWPIAGFNKPNPNQRPFSNSAPWN